MGKEIICADAFDWLASNKAGAICTSPPDAEEIGASIDNWEGWFSQAIDLCLRAAPIAVFYVTDRKSDGALRSKAALVLSAAARSGVPVAWHKIALRRMPGKVDIHRPGFSHVIAVGGRSGTATADTFERGRVLYPNGTGLIAARVMVEWASRGGVDVADPFCGRGTIPAVAEALGVKAVGVDIDEAQCAKARACVLRVAT